jgi:epoxyqueuosine reductase
MQFFPANHLKSKALELGFNLVGVTAATPSPHLDAYLRWVEAGMHGSMGYMARPDRIIRRRDLNVILPSVRSLVVVGLDYATFAVPQATLSDPARGRIAAYAWGLDYHDILTPRLELLAEWLCAQSGQAALKQRVYVDTGALLERDHAHSAGLGFTGKNTMLIHPHRGSTFFLGEILTDLPFDHYDMPGKATMCGRCTRCLAACPTDAFPQPHVLDARRCISYLTIEHKGWIPHDLRRLMGNWVYGCDMCQDVCPFQRFALPAAEAAFYPASIDRAAPPLVDLLALDAAAFHARYSGSAIERIGRERLVRNACIAAGNWGSEQVVPHLEALLADTSPLLRGHAGWALARIRRDRAQIRSLLDRETAAEAHADLAVTFASLQD